MKPRDRLLVVLDRLAALAVALAFWSAVALAFKDLMQ